VVADRVPRNILEQIYKITLPKPKPYESQSRPPTAAELLRAYCASRGHVSHAGLPDETRAARQILKDYIDGKIPHFELPPGVTDVEKELEIIARSEGPTTSSAVNESDADDLDEEDEDAVDPAEPDMRDVLDDLESFDLANGGSKTAAKKKKEASHKHHKKPQRKKDQSWRVGNDGGDGTAVVRVFQKPAVNLSAVGASGRV